MGIYYLIISFVNEAAFKIYFAMNILPHESLCSPVSRKRKGSIANMPIAETVQRKAI